MRSTHIERCLRRATPTRKINPSHQIISKSSHYLAICVAINGVLVGANQLDLEELDLTQFLNFTDSLKFNWSDDTLICRQTIYELYRLTYQVNPIYKLVAIESIESISNIFFSNTAPVTQELKFLKNGEYPDFGNPHLLAEKNHSVHSDETKEFITNMHLAEDIRKQACKLFNKIFELFTVLVDMLVNFAEEYKVKELLTMVI